eukprot:5122191-Amphidinium_carterae.1
MFFFPRCASNVTQEEDQRGLTHSLYKSGPNPRKSSCWGTGGAHWAARSGFQTAPECQKAG